MRSRPAPFACAFLAYALGAPSAWADPAAPTDAALASATDAARSHFKTGIKLYQDQNYAGALAEFEAAYALAPRPLLLYHLGRCYQALGRDAEARTAFDRFLASGPKGGAAADARARLAGLSAPPPPPAAQPEPPPPPPAATAAAAPEPAPPPRFVIADDEPPRRSTRPRWPWLGAGGVALAGGLVLDLVPSSASNGELDALDLLPVALYAVAATAVFLGLR